MYLRFALALSQLLTVTNERRLSQLKATTGKDGDNDAR